MRGIRCPMTIAELDRRQAQFTEQLNVLLGLWRQYRLRDTDERCEIRRLLEKGLPRGAGVPPDLDGVNVGIGIHAIERELKELAEYRELLVSQLPSEAEMAESAERAARSAASQVEAALRLQDAWDRLITASETLDDCVLAVEEARADMQPGTRVPLPDVAYIALIGGALRTLAATCGSIDDPTLRNELNAARVARAATV